MPDQNTFQERLKRLESKSTSVQPEAVSSPSTPPRENSTEFNYIKAIAAFGAVFAVSMIGLVIFTIQQTSG